MLSMLFTCDSLKKSLIFGRNSSQEITLEVLVKTLDVRTPGGLEVGIGSLDDGEEPKFEDGITQLHFDQLRVRALVCCSEVPGDSSKAVAVKLCQHSLWQH